MKEEFYRHSLVVPLLGWGHCIRDELHYQNHFDYIHYNPVEQGYVQLVKDCSYSLFHSVYGLRFWLKETSLKFNQTVGAIMIAQGE